MTATDTQTVDEAPEDPSPGPRPVQVLLAEVAHDLPAIGKDDRNEQQGFNYRGIERIMRDVGPALSRAGILVVPTVLDRQVELLATRNGSTWRLVSLTIRYDFIGPGGDRVSATTVGEGYDPADKAASKAMTTAYKYALVQVLQIGEGVDVEEANYGDDAQATGTARAAAPPQRKASEVPVEELVRPLVNVYGPQHAAEVANLLSLMRPLPADRKRAFAERFGKPGEIRPDQMEEAWAWWGVEGHAVSQQDPPEEG